MRYIIVISIISTIVSFIFDKKKTIQALKITWKKLNKILIPFTETIIVVSLSLTVIPNSIYSKLSAITNKFLSISIGLSLGSISAMPGFIVFPLSGELIKKGVPYFVLSSFTTTLMMVGISTFTLEQKLLGGKNMIYRNITAILISIITAVATGFIYGEFK